MSEFEEKIASSLMDMANEANDDTFLTEEEAKKKLAEEKTPKKRGRKKSKPTFVDVDEETNQEDKKENDTKKDVVNEDNNEESSKKDVVNEDNNEESSKKDDFFFNNDKDDNTSTLYDEDEEDEEDTNTDDYLPDDIFSEKTPSKTDVNDEIDELKDSIDSLIKEITPVMENSEIIREKVSKMEFNLDNMIIGERSSVNSSRTLNFILNNKPKTQIVANQSYYIAFMEGLNYNEITQLYNSTMDRNSNDSLLYKIVYSKINTTSVGQMSYQEWLNNTSLFDFDNFLYGIYLQTFPGDTKFDITCGHCKQRISASINNDTLISGRNKNALINVQYVLNNRTKGRDLLLEAPIHKHKRIRLPYNNIIVDIKVPTLGKRLNLINSVSPETKEKYESILAMMLFIDRIYVIDVEKSMNTGNLYTNEIFDRGEISRLVRELKVQDSDVLQKAINDMVLDITLDYSIKSFPCPHCHKETGNISVDMNTLLFQQILRRS